MKYDIRDSVYRVKLCMTLRYCKRPAFICNKFEWQMLHEIMLYACVCMRCFPFEMLIKPLNYNLFGIFTMHGIAVELKRMYFQS